MVKVVNTANKSEAKIGDEVVYTIVIKSDNKHVIPSSIQTNDGIISPKILPKSSKDIKLDNLTTAGCWISFPAGGCTLILTSISVVKPINAFTPNNHGINDFWHIPNIE